jgi:photosystem II stability/assembly factor-like uncharacterized protein
VGRVEIEGVFRSMDGGDTWTHLETRLYHPDIHAVTVAATQPKRLYASTAREVFTSNNLGETWQPLGIKRKVAAALCPWHGGQGG